MAKALYLISYDVIDNKRRTRIFKYLSAHGFAIQKSVFVVYDYLANMRTITSRLDVWLEQEDKLMCMTIDSDSFFHAQSLPLDGVMFTHEHPLMDRLLNGNSDKAKAA